MNMIDVSGWQHPDGAPIDWHEVAAFGVTHAFIKATEGLSYVSPYLREDADGAATAGIKAGFYHFAHPGASGPAEQATYCAKAIADLPRSIGVALDLETTEGQSWAVLDVWGRAFLDALPRDVINRSLYSNGYFLSNLPSAPWGRRLWLAQWGGPTPRQGSVWAWQSGTGEVPGVQGLCDVGTFFG